MFEVKLSDDAERHLKGFSARNQRLIVQAIEDQLVHQPIVPTLNRKQLRTASLATWELRVQEFRVLYNVEVDALIVLVVAIATKDGNKFVIEGEEHIL